MPCKFDIFLLLVNCNHALGAPVWISGLGEKTSCQIFGLFPFIIRVLMQFSSYLKNKNSWKLKLVSCERNQKKKKKQSKKLIIK